MHRLFVVLFLFFAYVHWGSQLKEKITCPLIILAVLKHHYLQGMWVRPMPVYLQQFSSPP